MRIFISYRRADTGHLAARLDDRLATADDVDHIFRDVTAIRSGDPWRATIDEAIAKADVAIVVIGPRFLDGKRLFADDDVVRAEVRSALAAAADNRQRVVPVLVDGAAMPGVADLPADLSELPQYDAAFLRLTSFERDVEALADDLGLELKKDVTLVGTAVRAAIGAVGGAIALVAVALLHMALLERALDETMPRALVILLGLAFVTAGAYAGTRIRRRRLRRA